jgi:hypothetical protein
MDEEQIPALEAPAPLADTVNNSVKLPAFWSANIVGWFSSVEGIFELRGITSQQAKYFNVLAALPESTVVLIVDLVETSPLPADPFEQLKGQLVTTHQLTDIQWVEKLLALPPLGKQKPSELLAEMVRICHRGEENSVSFICHFLQKLPRELRILLSETDMSVKRQLSAKADQIWVHNAQLHHDTVAAIAPEALEALVAAIQSGSFNRGGRGAQRSGNSVRGRGRGRAVGNSGGPSGGGQAGKPTPLKLARQASGLCFFHF